MPRIIDLSMPIADHFRWPVERRLKSDHERGDLFQVTWLGFAVHGFTHMDSPRHFFADGRTTSDIPLEATVGNAAQLKSERLAAARAAKSPPATSSDGKPAARRTTRAAAGAGSTGRARATTKTTGGLKRDASSLAVAPSLQKPPIESPTHRRFPAHRPGAEHREVLRR